MNERPGKAQEFLLSETELEASKILKYRNAKNPRINIEDFRGIHKDADIDKDLALLKEKEDSIARKEAIDPESVVITKSAAIFEDITIDEINSHGWFGPNASVIKTSKFDDLINKVDAVVEFDLKQGISHLALGVDVTSSLRADVLDEKLEGIKSKLVGGHLGSVKYFRSSGGEMKGGLSGIPEVIIICSNDLVEELVDDWVAYHKLSPKKLDSNLELSEGPRKSLLEKHGRMGEELKNHFIQILFLKEVEMQLELQINFVQKRIKEIEDENFYAGLQKTYDLHKKLETTVLDTLNNSLSITRGLLAEKKNIPATPRMNKILDTLKNRLSIVYSN